MSKILFIASSLDAGGAQRVLSNILMYLPEEWTLHILLNNAKNICFPYRGRLFDLNIPNNTNRQSLKYQGKVFLKRLREIRRLKRTNNYDYVVSFLESANITNVLTRSSNCKSVLTSHSQLSMLINKNKKYKLLIQPLVKLLYNKADCLVVVSSGVKMDYTKNFGIESNRVKIIYNGIDALSIDKAVGSHAKPSDNVFRICTIGRLTEQKGQWHLIRAITGLIKEGLKIELHILGEGKLEKYLRNLAKNLGIASNVFFEGFVNPPFAKMSEYDLFVFPSLWEGFGNVIIEAAACGLPTISSDYKSGAREILAPGTDITNKVTTTIEYAQYGILVPVCSGIKHNAEAKLEPEEKLLQEAIRTMISDHELYSSYKNKCRELAHIFSMDTISKQWIDLLKTDKELDAVS